MSQIQIGTLFKINQAQAEILRLTTEIDKLESSLGTTAENYKNEEEIFAKTFEQKQIQAILLEQQAQNLANLRSSEAEYRLKIGQVIDTSISNYLTAENIKALIADILASNPGKISKLIADPSLASDLGIIDFEAGSANQLRVEFEFSSYILDMPELYASLRPRLLTKILNCCRFF